MVLLKNRLAVLGLHYFLAWHRLMGLRSSCSFWWRVWPWKAFEFVTCLAHSSLNPSLSLIHRIRWDSPTLRPSPVRPPTLSLLTIHSLSPTTVKEDSAPAAASKHLQIYSPAPRSPHSQTHNSHGSHSGNRPTGHLLLSLNKDPRILVLRQDFVDFIPGCSDGLDNPHWGEVFLGCHKNGIVFSLVEVTQIQHQRLGVIDAFLLGPEWSEWWKLARLH